MDLMVVEDVMLGKSGHTILSGPLLLKGLSRSSEVERVFGERVTISNVEGERLLVPVKGVSFSQAMSGRLQVSLAIAYSGDHGDVALNSSVSDES